jgi:hypothetical protein
MRKNDMFRSLVAAVTILSFTSALAFPAGLPARDERTAPPGTTMQVRTLDTYGSDRNKAGDEVRSELTGAVTSEGKEIFPAGSLVFGKVVDVKSKGRGQSNGELEIVFNRVRTPDGKEYNIVANLEGASRYTKDSWKRRLYTIGIAVGAGMLISKIFGGTFRRGILLGAAAGTGYVLYKEGDDVVLPAGTTVNLVLEEAVSVSYSFGGVQKPAVTQQTQAGVTEVLLRNGNSQRGEFDGITPDSKVTLRIDYGGIQIPLADISEIVFAPGGASDQPSATSDTFYLLNGRILLGGFLGYEDGRFLVGTDYGELRIPLEDIARIVLSQ